MSKFIGLASALIVALIPTTAFSTPKGENVIHSAAKLTVSQLYCGDVLNYDPNGVQRVFDAANSNNSYLGQQWFAEFVKTHEGAAKLSINGHCRAIYDMFGPSGSEFPGVVSRK